MLDILDTVPDEESWYLIHCKPRRESYAADYLRSVLQLSVFLPESSVRSQREIRRVPFFPGYIFLHVNLHEVALSQINTCPGVRRLVEFGGSPNPVPQYIIEAIQGQLAYLNGLIPQPSHGLRPGDHVRVKQGPLQDLNMIFIGPTTPSKRVHVLLEMLGRLKETQVDVALLEKISELPSSPPPLRPKGERYTRGKGRRIKSPA